MKVTLTRQSVIRLQLNPEFYDTDERMLERLREKAVDDARDCAYDNWTVYRVHTLMRGEMVGQVQRVAAIVDEATIEEVTP